MIKELRMVDITKRFPGVLANDRVNFDVRSGEIHALLGENGAGKSTLMRQLYGLYKPDGGQIILDGKPTQFNSPNDAIRAGIGMIHQHFMLVPALTVAENVALGLQSSRGPMLDLDKVSKKIDELGQKYSLKVQPDAQIWQLSVGEQQRVEILKALYRGAQLLALDEPTAVLTPQEVTDFFKVLRQMADNGHSLIFISHKLHEIIDVCTRVTVMRDGRVVSTHPVAGSTKSMLAGEMVGREVILEYDKTPFQPGEPKLVIDGVRVKGDRGQDALKDVSLTVHAGEILGIAGVSGNGQRELAEALTGLRPVTKGKVTVTGHDVTSATPAQRIAAGLAAIPEERMKDGVVRDFGVTDNLILRDHAGPPFSRAGFLDFAAIEHEGKKLVDGYRVKTPTLTTPTKNLSGGNIQKLILARELSRKPDVLVCAQPTRGVDIGASEYIHQRLLEQRERGMANLLISEDLDELLALSDRVAVMFEGKVMAVLERSEATLEDLGLLMAGVVPFAMQKQPA
ncbi:MAG TPA: ABC transporter ATP-binding protein [Thermoflexales bacterium]|nr:ABC transporter ATP-binding protein [Thermoflexales bacterium]HQW36024.1 ABC transporter ATP-binding protein [Thermoflexales bacterium]HQX75206.1 ABC transporter ATP-binding protein [Thermoflexales bacterium]